MHYTMIIHALLWCVLDLDCAAQGILEEVRLISWPDPLQVRPTHPRHAC